MTVEDVLAELKSQLIQYSECKAHLYSKNIVQTVGNIYTADWEKVVIKLDDLRALIESEQEGHASLVVKGSVHTYYCAMNLKTEIHSGELQTREDTNVRLVLSMSSKPTLIYYPTEDSVIDKDN